MSTSGAVFILTGGIDEGLVPVVLFGLGLFTVMCIAFYLVDKYGSKK